MSDLLYYGSFFLDETKVTLSITVIYLLLSLFPSMFQVSSLLMFNFYSIFDQHQYWRIVTGMFTVNHPDCLALVLFMLYISRSYEYYQGPLAQCFQVLLCMLISSFPFCILGFIPAVRHYYEDEFIVGYTLALPNALAGATIVSLRQVADWRGEVGKMPVIQAYGYIVILILSACHRFRPECFACTVWGALTGMMVSFITKATCGRSKCSQMYERHARRRAQVVERQAD